jgi:hypothetical protein
MKANQIKLFQWGVGACDASTGLLLVIAPVWTLHLMGIETLPEPADIISFVGIFVFAVGLSYFLVNSDDLAGWKMQWKITALVRLLVAVFLLWKIMVTGWEIRWVSVLLTDLVVASIQILGLKRGWLGGRG